MTRTAFLQCSLAGIGMVALNCGGSSDPSVANGPDPSPDAATDTSTAGTAGQAGRGGNAGSAGTGAGGAAGTAGSDAGPDAAPQPCTVFGDVREAPCGNCGRQTETCTSAGYWSPVGTCENQSGECPAGQLEERNAGTCSAERRTCSAACSWGAWEPLHVNPCTPGTDDYEAEGCEIGLLKKKTCGSDCQYQISACGNHCAGSPRTLIAELPEVQEICVPAGKFVRGDDSDPSSMPIAEVQVSAYYIDRYPVTNRRYARCVDAGVCNQPVAGSGYEDRARAAYMLQGVTKAEAAVFCAWDGSRRLPTEAQWEKAARGPAPRYTKYIWGDEKQCPTARCPTNQLLENFAYDKQPKMRGFYGAEPMGAAPYEIVHDAFDAQYYARAESLVDPLGPATGGEVVRGYPAVGTGFFDQPIGSRLPHASLDNQTSFTFRCARPA